MANKLMSIAQQVIAGDFGSGEERIKALKKKGYDPDKVQEEVNRELSCRELIIQNMRAWAIKVSAEPYHYVYWTEPYGHECAKCQPHGGKNKGWQCIGWAIACWRHGGGLPIPCNCGVIDNGTGEKILKAKTDAEALKIAQKELKIKDIKVIRNDGKVIPKDWVQAGDIGALFTGTEFQHLLMFMGNGKLTDSTSCKNKADDIRADRNFAGRYATRLKVLIRYTGKGLVKPAKKTVDTLAHEVIDGLWYSGDVRKKALTECGYDYESIQKRVNEILNPEPTPKPSKKSYSGKYPSYRLKKTREQVIADAIRWAKWIASNNDFHYGYGKGAHHNGCYFCGTQPASKKKAGIKMWETTYCCNPFVGAVWAHGGGLPEALKLCSHGKSWDFRKGGGYDASKLFDNLGHPDKSKLKAGDVLCKDTHVAFYIGNGKIAEASGGDDNVIKSTRWNNSIKVKTLSDGTYKGFPRVHRYNGNGVNADRVIAQGEVSDRIYDLQNYLNWFGNYKLTVDGIFGVGTLDAVKKMQKALGLTADGKVGKATLDAMKAYKK